MITNKDLSIDRENGKITLNGNKYDLGTQGEIDAAVKDVYSVMGQNGAKNLIPYPYYSESGYSNQGMTITYDADGVFTINKVAGTATAYYRIATLKFLKPSTKYRLVFEVENATSISIFLQKPTTGDYVTINNKSSGIFVAEFETTADSQINSRAIGLSCTASDTETNATVKVMLVYASDTDNTYQPYAKTNRQLTEVIGDLSQTGLTGDSVAEQLGSAKTYVDNAVSYKAGDVIADENVVATAIGSNANDCYFSIPISKPVSASSVVISDVVCNLYYGTNQRETVENAAYTATIEKGSLLVKMEKANTFSQYGRYIVDFTGTFTFS